MLKCGMSKKILMLEDDKNLGATLCDMLESEGYAVDWAQDGERAAELSYDRSYALYLFDVNVPFLNGFELLEELRSARDMTPTLFMSARIDMESISEGFRSGAFDYIKKPFYPEELLIRINAKIGTLQQQIVYGDLTYDPQHKTIVKASKPITLGTVQMCLFEQFIHRVGVIVDMEELLECLEHPSTSTLRVALNKLRQTVGFELSNIRGVGYRLEPHGA